MSGVERWVLQALVCGGYLRRERWSYPQPARYVCMGVRRAYGTVDYVQDVSESAVAALVAAGLIAPARPVRVALGPEADHIAYQLTARGRSVATAERLDQPVRRRA
jgi:hypothetical protein